MGLWFCYNIQWVASSIGISCRLYLSSVRPEPLEHRIQKTFWKSCRLMSQLNCVRGLTWYELFATHTAHQWPTVELVATHIPFSHNDWLHTQKILILRNQGEHTPHSTMQGDNSRVCQPNQRIPKWTLTQSVDAKVQTMQTIQNQVPGVSCSVWAIERLEIVLPSDELAATFVGRSCSWSTTPLYSHLCKTMMISPPNSDDDLTTPSHILH